MAELRHFLELDRLDKPTLRAIIDDAARLKSGAGDGAGGDARPLAGKTLAMLFEKPSTRTRVSFEVAIRQLGGEAVIIESTASQMGRGETAADTARVLSRYVDAIMLRTAHAETLYEVAEFADVPVINGLTDLSHPCQLMADVMTFEEHRGPIGGRTVAWSGDGNNVARTWVHAAVQFGFEMRLAGPPELWPHDDLLAWAVGEGGRVSYHDDPFEAVAGADCVVTDTWVSMGHDAFERRHNLLARYRIDEKLMAAAATDAIFMHCLPAHRGEEVSGSVIDGAQSVVWDEAENRLHAQKGILLWCLDQGPLVA